MEEAMAKELSVKLQIYMEQKKEKLMRKPRKDLSNWQMN